MGGTSPSGFTLWVHSKEFDLKFMPENWFHYLSNLLRKPIIRISFWQSECYSEFYFNIYFKFTPNNASCVTHNIASKLRPYIGSNIILNGSLNISPKITPNITPNFIRNLKKLYKIFFKCIFLNFVTPKITTNSTPNYILIHCEYYAEFEFYLYFNFTKFLWNSEYNSENCLHALNNTIWHDKPLLWYSMRKTSTPSPTPLKCKHPIEPCTVAKGIAF